MAAPKKERSRLAAFFDLYKRRISEKFNDLKYALPEQRKYDPRALYNSRVFVASVLVLLIPFCYSHNSLFYFLFNLSAICIFKELDLSNNYARYLFYILPIFYSQLVLEKKIFLQIVIYTQISDIFQYIGGKIGNYTISKILNFLREELSGIAKELKKDPSEGNINIKNLLELFIFCEKNVEDIHIIPVSPNKTISGYAAGVISCFIIFSYLNSALSYKMNLFWYVLGCLGDIYASYIKREMGIKDFSKILGEHGGVLDRFDSTIGVVHFYFWAKIFS